MDTHVCLENDLMDRCYTISPMVSVMWDTDVVYCGFRAAYKVTLMGTVGRTKVRIFCRTDEGVVLDKNEADVSTVLYRGKVLIPFNVRPGTRIQIEIQLPGYNIVCKSDCRPVHNSIPASVTYVTDDTSEVSLDAVRAEVARFEEASHLPDRNVDRQKSGLPVFISALWHTLKSLPLF